jgi:RHS repeat-associated protein
MSTVYYDAVDDQLVAQAQDGAFLDYGIDALGSVVATMDSSSTVERTYRYEPFGSTSIATGAGTEPRFRWIGSPGYRTTGGSIESFYVRARHYSAKHGSWTTKDPLWPSQLSYVYVNAQPSCATDPSGLLLYGFCHNTKMWLTANCEHRRGSVVRPQIINYCDGCRTCGGCSKPLIEQCRVSITATGLASGRDVNLQAQWDDVQLHGSFACAKLNYIGPLAGLLDLHGSDLIGPLIGDVSQFLSGLLKVLQPAWGLLGWETTCTATFRVEAAFFLYHHCIASKPIDPCNKSTPKLPFPVRFTCHK